MQQSTKVKISQRSLQQPVNILPPKTDPEVLSAATCHSLAGGPLAEFGHHLMIRMDYSRFGSGTVANVPQADPMATLVKLNLNLCQIMV